MIACEHKLYIISMNSCLNIVLLAILHKRINQEYWKFNHTINLLTSLLFPYYQGLMPTGQKTSTL